MKVVVLDKLIRNNLTLFRHLIHRQAEKTEKHFKIARKAYEAFVNIHTGELCFKELDNEFTPSREWCHVLIQLRLDCKGAFELIQPEHKEVFNCFDFEPKAYVQLSKTMALLNQLSYDPKNGHNPFWILRHMAHIDFLLSYQEEGKMNFIHDAWYACNRLEAEKLLKNLPVGTFLFRKGSSASLLEDLINQTRKSPVSCINITFRSDEKKIGEKILVYCDGKWIVFDDDIKLQGPHFSTLKKLIDSLGTLASQPLLVA